LEARERRWPSCTRCDCERRRYTAFVERALKLFDRVVVAVAVNIQKQGLFSPEERVELIRASIDNSRVEVDRFDGLLVDYCRRRGATVVIRGLRAVADFEYEFQLAHMNRRLSTDVDTVFLMTGEEHFYVSSNLIREVAGFGGDVSGLVPGPVLRALRKKGPKR
jgi:pantetheine-phosphate adenylyltransferase